MPRTTAELVQGILLDQFDEEDDLDPFIDAANGLVTAVCDASGYDSGYLEKIERWLSAHFYKVVKRQEIREEVGTVRATYEGKVDLRLQVTEFGQQAMLLDYKGGLAAVNNQSGSVLRGKASIDYLGSDPE